MSSMQGIYKDTQKVTQPWESVVSVTKSIVIDSRQRDCIHYPNPSVYTINLENTFKNVTSIELRGAIFPKSSYNIHSSNNKIDFAIGDSVTSFMTIDPGAGYTSPPTVTLSSPPGAGVTATATAVIDAFGTISNMIINIAGSGYSPSRPPSVTISPPNNVYQARQARIVAVVGTHYTAVLRPGEYDIGGNPAPPINTLPTNLLLEIQNAMNYIVNGGAYNPLSNSPFAARVVNQYPLLNATAGTPEAFDTNACLFNRIQVVNVNSSIWEFLWGTGPNKIASAASVFGFNTIDTGPGVTIAPIVGPGGLIIPGGTAIRGTYDYNLKNDPDYVIMSLQLNNQKMDRVKSPNDGLDDTFAVLLFDNNATESLHDLGAAAPAGTIVSVGGVQYLSGPTGKGVFWTPTGSVKPIKGADYDSKKLSFKPPIASVTSITVTFTKFGTKSGGAPYFYNMDGREHTLLFEISSNDQKTQQRQ